MVRNKLIVAAAAAAALAVPAMAEQRVERSVVSYADLDVTTAKGFAALQSRVDSRIRSMCRDYGKQTEASRITAQGCVAEARADADAKLRSLNAGGAQVEVIALMR